MNILVSSWPSSSTCHSLNTTQTEKRSVCIHDRDPHWLWKTRRYSRFSNVYKERTMFSKRGLVASTVCWRPQNPVESQEWARWTQANLIHCVLSQERGSAERLTDPLSWYVNGMRWNAAATAQVEENEDIAQQWQLSLMDGWRRAFIWYMIYIYARMTFLISSG